MASVQTATIDGQVINIETLDRAVAKSIAKLRAGAGFTLFTLNLDHLVKRRTDPAFRQAYARATFVTADGAPIAWLARRAGMQVARTTGADLVAPLCAAAAEHGIKVALFGSSQESLRAAARVLRHANPDLDIVFVEAPRHGFDPLSAEAIAAGDRIAQSGARLCLVALGAPKQELFSDLVAGRHPEIGFLGIGAALDFLSGEQRRAPLWAQQSGLEWAHRLVSNPRRLAPRYARCAMTLFEIVCVDPVRRRIADGLFARS